MFNPLNEKFKTFQNKSNKFLPIISIQKDKNQNLILSTTNQGLLSFNTQTERFESILIGSSNSQILFSHFLGGNNILVKSIKKGLYRTQQNF